MTNKERQKSLDKKKWLESQTKNLDCNGIMFYCVKCQYRSKEFVCLASQEKRETLCLCAKAYNRAQRK